MRLGGFACVLAMSVVACSSAADDDAESSDENSASAVAEGVQVSARSEARTTTAKLEARFGPSIPSGHPIVVTRAANADGVETRVVVDALTYESSVVTASALAAGSRAGSDSNTPYGASLASLSASGKALESLDRGPALDGIDEPFALTVDMCQSQKPWEKRLFDWAVNLAGQLGKPVPIGIAMTGGWLRAHPGEFEQLLEWQRSQKIAITWINHSNTHPLNCLNASCSKAEFMTSASVNVDTEVLGLERELLARGQVPSVLFRFPGLVHNAERLSQVEKLGLFPLDADAWIAKGQPIAPRAVVLVHGNGNEAIGITSFLQAVNEPRRAAALRSGKSALVSALLVAPR